LDDPTTKNLRCGPPEAWYSRGAGRFSAVSELLAKRGTILHDYPVIIEALTSADGGGFLATVPDLPGCMSDGETREMAARNIEDAIAGWIEEADALGRRAPEPTRLAIAGR
jgi:antitoxin HicB